jgi:hypothetical protein
MKSAMMKNDQEMKAFAEWEDIQRMRQMLDAKRGEVVRIFPSQEQML